MTLIRPCSPPTIRILRVARATIWRSSRSCERASPNLAPNLLIACPLDLEAAMTRLTRPGTGCCVLSALFAIALAGCGSGSATGGSVTGTGWKATAVYPWPSSNYVDPTLGFTCVAPIWFPTRDTCTAWAPAALPPVTLLRCPQTVLASGSRPRRILRLRLANPRALPARDMSIALAKCTTDPIGTTTCKESTSRLYLRLA